jgi:hypothetical protein
MYYSKWTVYNSYDAMCENGFVIFKLYTQKNVVKRKFVGQIIRHFCPWTQKLRNGKKKWVCAQKTLNREIEMYYQ